MNKFQTKPGDLRTIFEKYRYDSTIELKSKTWFRQQANILSRKVIDKNKLFTENTKVSRIIPGKLYMFYYDPKLKDELPYYDTFPLVFPFKALPDGFLGLNMHYLPYFHRVQLMSRLMEYANNKTLDENSKIKYSWQLINGVSRFKDAEPCVKRYLMGHVRTQFIEVHGQDWHTAMMLPVESFQGSHKNTVWRESVRR